MSSAAEDAAGWRALIARDALPRLAVVCAGVWLHAADELLMATMGPAIIAEIGGAGLLSWTLSLYELGSIVAGAGAALAAMRLGLAATMAGAALTYGLGCALSALAASMPQMLAGRLIQGAGGGGLVALTYLAVATLFPRAQMPRAMAAVSALWGVSSFLGPLVGGAFAEAGLWRGGFWFFGAQALGLALGVPLALRGRPRDADAGPPRAFPLRRLLALAAGVVAVSAGGQADGALAAAALVAAGLALLAWFVRLDWRAGEGRMLPARAFDPRDPVGAALLMASLLAAATVALAVYGPLVLTRVHGLSAIEAGYVVAAASVGWSVAAVAVAGSPERRDAAVIGAGVALLAAGVTGYATSILSGPVWLLALFAACDGGGFGLAWTFVLRRATALADPSDLDRLATALPTMHRLGYGVGAAWVGVVANRFGMADDADLATLGAAAQAGFLACLPVLAAGVLAAAAFLRPAPRPSER